MYMNVVVAIIAGIELSRSCILHAIWLCVSDVDTNTCAKTEWLDEYYTMSKQMCECRMMHSRNGYVKLISFGSNQYDTLNQNESIIENEIHLPLLAPIHSQLFMSERHFERQIYLIFIRNSLVQRFLLR